MKNMNLLRISAVGLLLFSASTFAQNSGTKYFLNGEPFNYLQSETQKLQAQVDLLLENFLTMESRLAAAEEAITFLQADVEANAELILALEDEILRILAALETKQNIVDGKCPMGEAIREVNEDGTVICGTVSGGAAGIDTVYAYQSTNVVGKTVSVVATCPSGYKVTGGGFTAPTGRVHASRISGNGWLVSAYTQYGRAATSSWAICTRLI